MIVYLYRQNKNKPSNFRLIQISLENENEHTDLESKVELANKINIQDEWSILSENEKELLLKQKQI